MFLTIDYWTEKHIDDVIEMLEEAQSIGLSLEQAIQGFKDTKKHLLKKTKSKDK